MADQVIRTTRAGKATTGPAPERQVGRWLEVRLALTTALLVAPVQAARAAVTFTMTKLSMLVLAPGSTR